MNWKQLSREGVAAENLSFRQKQHRILFGKKGVLLNRQGVLFVSEEALFSREGVLFGKEGVLINSKGVLLNNEEALIDRKGALLISKEVRLDKKGVLVNRKEVLLDNKALLPSRFLWAKTSEAALAFSAEVLGHRTSPRAAWPGRCGSRNFPSRHNAIFSACCKNEQQFLTLPLRLSLALPADC